jgi:hypothetical protein
MKSFSSLTQLININLSDLSENSWQKCERSALVKWLMTSILSAISIITYLTKYVKLGQSGAEEKDMKKAPTIAGAF